MLKNELRYIEELLFTPETFCTDTISEIDIEWQCKLIREAWEKAIFSDLSEHSLMRYFHFHLNGLSKLSDGFLLSDYNNYSRDIGEALLSLIEHLKNSYSPYFNLDVRVSMVFQQKFIAQLESSLSLINNSLQVSRLSSSLKTCLLNWLSELTEQTEHLRYSYRTLNYLEQIIHQIRSIDLHSDKAEEILVTTLSRADFNHLSFFVYRQDRVRDTLSNYNSAQEKLDYLHEEKAFTLSCPEVKNSSYDSSWPSLKTMLSTWLQEEISLAEQALRKEIEVKADSSMPKLPIQMSVAHMACIIRLLFEENVFATNNLKLIFKCFAGHYQTKRQSAISPGSLSKEFYSIDQHTAARVRDLLQKMVLRINRNFFPVWVVISATVLCCPNMC